MSPRKSIVSKPFRDQEKPAAAPRSARRRRFLALGAGAVGLALVGAGWWAWGHRRVDVTPADSTAVGLQAKEVRLLATARREPANPAPCLELAEEYSAAARPASACWAYEVAAERTPRDAAIRLKLAASMLRLGQVQEAEATIRTVLASGGGTAAQARQDLADLQTNTGRRNDALATLKAAGREADLARGRIDEALGQVGAAREFYQRVGATGDADGYERLARLELAAGNVHAAQEAVRSMLQRRSARPEDLLLTAAIHAAGGTPKELNAGLDALLRLVQLEPRNAEAYYQAGLLFLRRGDRKGAAEQFDHAAKLDPNHAEARGRLAELLEAMGQTARAHREWAVYYELKDQPDRSLVELRRAGAAGLPDDPERALKMVRTASEMQQLPTAVKEAQEGLKRHPGDPGLLLQLGLLHQMGGSRVALEQLCRDWEARQPNSGMPYWLRGRLAVGETRIEDAIHLLETACQKEPQRSDFSMALGVSYLAVPTPENLTRARTWLEKAVALNPRSAGAHQQLGRLQQQTGDWDGARRQYLLSLDIQPGQTGVLNQLAQVSTRLQCPEQARLFAKLAKSEEERTRVLGRLRQQVRDHPMLPGARVDLARFLVRQEELAAARSQLERAAEMAPAAVQIRQALAEVERLLRVQAS